MALPKSPLISSRLANFTLHSPLFSTLLFSSLLFSSLLFSSHLISSHLISSLLFFSSLLNLVLVRMSQIPIVCPSWPIPISLLPRRHMISIIISDSRIPVPTANACASACYTLGLARLLASLLLFPLSSIPRASRIVADRVSAAVVHGFY
jgi:hypothetical protein